MTALSFSRTMASPFLSQGQATTSPMHRGVKPLPTQPSPTFAGRGHELKGQDTLPTGDVEERPLVMVESPYSNDDDQVMQGNIDYAQMAMIDSLYFHGESPMLTHLIYTQVIDEATPDRDFGIKAGQAWRRAASQTIPYVDRGISNGMIYAIAAALKDHKSKGNAANDQTPRPVAYRSLEDDTTENHQQVQERINTFQQQFNALKSKGLPQEVTWEDVEEDLDNVAFCGHKDEVAEILRRMKSERTRGINTTLIHRPVIDLFA